MWNTPQRGTSAEEIFNNKIDRMTCFVATSQPLFPVTMLLPDGPMNKVATVSGWGLYMDQTTWTFTHQDPSG